MQQTKVSNNQQVTLEYMAGLWDGEGHFSIGKINCGKHYQYKGQIAFLNTDPKLINFVTDVLNDMDIAFYIRLRAKSSVGKNQYEISINAMDSQRRFLEAIIPHLKGLKQDEASLVYKFIKSRIDRKNKLDDRRDKENGRFLAGKHTYTDEEISMFSEYKKLKVPQRLHAMPLPKALEG